MSRGLFLRGQSIFQAGKIDIVPSEICFSYATGYMSSEEWLFGDFDLKFFLSRPIWTPTETNGVKSTMTGFHAFMSTTSANRATLSCCRQFCLSLRQQRLNICYLIKGKTCMHIYQIYLNQISLMSLTVYVLCIRKKNTVPFYPPGLKSNRWILR